jgi:DNA-binding GntR family transcriptional regulator
MDISIPPIAQPASLADLVYNSLKELVLTSQIDPSQRLDERTLATQLGISRTPLREAIQRLVIEGFLRVEPRRGVFVNEKSKKEIVEILYVRAALESMGARLATRHVTETDVVGLRSIFSPFTPDEVERQTDEFSMANVNFHEQVLELSGCSKLIELASHIQDHMRMVRILTMRAGGRAQNALIEHFQIIEALENRDPDLSASRMREHILGLARHVEKAVGRFPWDK